MALPASSLPSTTLNVSSDSDSTHLRHNALSRQKMEDMISTAALTAVSPPPHPVFVGRKKNYKPSSVIYGVLTNPISQT